MRVVSGELKGRSLKAVPGTSTRPTTDKVKESLFNMIGPYFNGGLGLDLFAGSGGLGIEALSRGLDKVIFVDREGKAIHVVNENLKSVGLEDRAEVYRNDAVRALKAIRKRELVFNYIFLDPPYKKQQLVKLLEMISDEKLINAEGIIVCEHASDISLPEEVGSLIQTRSEKYGIIGITLFKLVGEDEGEV
ncbi:16S rRNA (guanine(966)-N(2))-methyltransferase RsmD [Mesobacillus subterraneus]|uniref:16S rRNA (Guanine(966)-N(2))-methyltransferase RsmD n=1 Tax=Mesobacillus subterraneus TaxID=285983 RepID=A0A3R9FYM0_9BACI|nr:16S rRNA (guanine(966)-N(2))-methyltransferase RsmD [Mesobacillus subterraneus]RSD28132.1 16S rRNA (guanine(966)-N(2))-methyltransferase RsmD [Mesobacillus subterraneus]